MKKRIIALLLSFALCIGLVGTAFAAWEEKFDDNGTSLGFYPVEETPAPDPGPDPDPDPEQPGDPGSGYVPILPPTSTGNGGGSSTTPAAPSYPVNVPSGIANGTVSVSPDSAKKGDTVTVTVTPDEGYELERLSVTDAEGNEVKTTDRGDGRHTFTMPGSKVSVEAVFAPITDEPSQPEQPEQQPMPFTDVKAGDWFCDAVAYVYANGIMKGDGSEATFNPNGKMTRAMVWTVLGRLSGADVDGSGSAWYAKAQAWAMAEGVSDGSSPMGSITREELVTMLWRYTQSPAAEADLSVFSDSAAVSAWALDAVRWAVSSGLLQGEGGRLNPTGEATRAQVAAILARYCESVAG